MNDQDFETYFENLEPLEQIKIEEENEWPSPEEVYGQAGLC